MRFFLLLLLTGCSSSPGSGPTDATMIDLSAPDLAGAITCTGGSTQVTCDPPKICVLAYPGVLFDMSTGDTDGGIILPDPPYPSCVDPAAYCQGVPTCDCFAPYCQGCYCREANSRYFSCGCI